MSDVGAWARDQRDEKEALRLLAEPEGKLAKGAAVKHAKPRMSLLPGEALLAVAEVLTAGAVKYEPESWKRAPFKKEDYLDAMMRHIAKILSGETHDEDSKQLHAAHVATNALFYLWYELKGK